jgi:hypothetical protein
VLRLVIVAISIVVTGMALFGVLYGFAGLELWRRPIGEPRTPFLACLFLLLVVPTAVAVLVGRTLGSRILDEGVKARLRTAWRWAFWPLATGYILTAAFGCPEVRNTLEHSMATAWAARLNHPPCEPELATYVALPVVPGVILSYDESEATCEAGGGAFLLHFWNGRRTTRLATLNVWVAP